MSSSDTSSLRLDHTQISLLTAPQNDSLTHIQNLFHVTFHLTTDGSNTLNITGNNHNQAAEAVKELLDSKSDMDDQTLQFGSTDSVNPHAALFHDESENNMEHVHVDVTEIPLDDQVRTQKTKFRIPQRAISQFVPFGYSIAFLGFISLMKLFFTFLKVLLTPIEPFRRGWKW